MLCRCAIFVCALVWVAATNGAATPRVAIPILVELFTAEGCSSCPPADRLFEQMIATQPSPGAELVGLGLHVDYWDSAGWRDRFSSAAFTARQQRYADRFKLDAVYTPQMVVDGQSAFVGSDVPAARRAIEEALAAEHGTLRVTVDGIASELSAAVMVDTLPPVTAGDRADVLVAVIENNLRTEVKHGENRGRTLNHAAVARTMVVAGDASVGTTVRAAIKLRKEWRLDALRVVAFVQERRSRRVLATAASPIG